MNHSPDPPIPLGTAATQAFKPALVPCKTCGKTFTAHSHSLRKYCSIVCRPLMTSGKVKRMCKVCAREFMGRKDQVTCSQLCRDRLKAQVKSPSYTPVAKVERTCGICKNTFQGNKSKRYCSEDCKVKGYKLSKRGRKGRKK